MTRFTGVGRGNNPASHKNATAASRQHRWKAGGSIASTGYVKLRVGIGHPLADPNGYAYEHLVIWCAAGNPRPPKGWLLHHRNEEKTDNRLANLELTRRGDHNAEHLAQEGRRCPATGRLLTKAAGRHLDGVLHDGFPA
jgi:hypothetical protein